MTTKWLAGCLGCFILCLATAHARPVQGAVIDGRVTSPSGETLEKVRVSLLSDTYSPLNTVYTDTSGRFRFTVSGSGAFYVELDPLSLPFERQQQRVEVNPSPYSHGGDLFHLDIVLTPLKNAATGKGVRFYQEVPAAAKTEFERAAKLLEKDREGAFGAMRHALEIFPDYYDCLSTLGAELVKDEKLDEAAPILTHAVDVNPSGETSLYALGVLYYKAGKFDHATESFSRAVSLEPKSVNAVLYLGLSQARDHKNDEAEVNLKRAYGLGAKGVADLHLALASIYIAAKRNPEAADQLKLLLKEVPNLRDRDKIKALIEKLSKG